jgi:hypothetical protein
MRISHIGAFESFEGHGAEGDSSSEQAAQIVSL